MPHRYHDFAKGVIHPSVRPEGYDYRRNVAGARRQDETVDDSLARKQEADAGVCGVCFRCGGEGTTRFGGIWACERHENELQQVAIAALGRPNHIYATMEDLDDE